MKYSCAAVLLLFVVLLPCSAQLPRVGNSLALRSADAFKRDSGVRRINDSVHPQKHFDSSVPPVSLRLADSTVVTGIPLCMSNGNLVISTARSFNPASDIALRAFRCVPLSFIDAIASDEAKEYQIWYVVKGSKQRMRSALRICCPVKAYERGVPPELDACVPAAEMDSVDASPPSPRYTRSTGWSFSAFAGGAITLAGPTATVIRNDGFVGVLDTLGVQQDQYTFGVEASVPIISALDLGCRGMVLAQPPTITDSSLQHSLGFDAYSLHAILKWYILPIDVAGNNSVELSTTVGVGPDILVYRGRTYRGLQNLTTSGMGVAVTASWTVQCMIELTKGLSVGLQGALWYQQGLSYSVDNIVIEQPFQQPWTATFTIPNQTASFLGANLVVCYTFPSSIANTAPEE